MQTADIQYRFATAEDDAAAIAKYLYLTDGYIYPTLCGTFSDPEWVDFIRKNLKEPTHIFFVKHLIVALFQGQIVGVCCFFPCGEEFPFVQNAPKHALQDYLYLEETYFLPLYRELASERGVYINNLCVEPACRRLGIGRGLMDFLIKQTSETDVILDVVADNSAAIALYREMGFEPQTRYMGFGGKANAPVPCLQMRRRASS